MTHHDGTADAHDDEKLGGEGTIPAGATGVAYTLIAPDDAENIANIEKLTGQTIQRLGKAEPTETREDAPAERAPRRGRGRAAPTEQPADVATEDEPVARAPREARPAREPRPAREARAPREAAPPRRDERSRRDERDDGPDEGWNGPVPDFLSATITG